MNFISDNGKTSNVATLKASSEPKNKEKADQDDTSRFNFGEMMK